MFSYSFLEKRRYVQCCSSILVGILMATSSMYISWMSPVLPQLTGHDSPIGYTVTNEEASWLSADSPIGAVLGFFISSPVLTRIGPKWTMIMSTIPLTVPWFVIAFTRSGVILHICRVIGGFGISFSTAGFLVYIGEISDKDMRGRIGSIMWILTVLGNSYVLNVGPYITYDWLSISCAVPSTIFLVFGYFMPESPYYLVKINKMDAARNSLNKLMIGGPDKDDRVETRLQEIKDHIDRGSQERNTVMELFTNKNHRKAMIIITGVVTMKHLSGIIPIRMELQSIIEISQSSISPELSSNLFGISQLCAVIVACIFIDKVGRKILFLISAFGALVSLIAEGIYFYLQNVAHADVGNLSWLPTVGIILYLFMNEVGLYTVPHVIISEIFATNVKNIGVSLSAMYSLILTFVVAKLYRPLASLWGIHVMFWLFAVFCGVGIIFIIFFLPETKGKTFEEIQNELSSNKSRKSRNFVEERL